MRVRGMLRDLKLEIDHQKYALAWVRAKLGEPPPNEAEEKVYRERMSKSDRYAERGELLFLVACFFLGVGACGMVCARTYLGLAGIVAFFVAMEVSLSLQNRSMTFVTAAWKDLKPQIEEEARKHPAPD